MRTLYQALKTAPWCIIGLFLGEFIHTYYDYRAHPGLYETYSAPWYTGLLLHGFIYVILIAVMLLLRLIIRKKLL